MKMKIKKHEESARWDEKAGKQESRKVRNLEEEYEEEEEKKKTENPENGGPRCWKEKKMGQRSDKQV